MEIGDILFCKNDEKVVVNYFDDKIIRIEYKGSLYERPISFVGETFLTHDSEGYDGNGYDKYGVSRDLKIKKGSPADVDYIEGETLLYHNVYGEGVFQRFNRTDTRIYLLVLFDVGEKSFVFPSCMKQGFLTREISSKIESQKQLLKTEYGSREYQEEKEYFKQITDKLDKQIRNIKSCAEEARFAYTEVSDGVYARSENTYEAYGEMNNLLTIRENPYFARVDTKEDGKMYIGKKQYGDIVDWADPRCSVYYDYQMFIGRETPGLSLVREFDIARGSFVNFTDVYSINATEQEDTLLRKIKTQRDEKNTHDIIDTIRSNQYKIITVPMNKNICVQGCAGSGKTMILLHRLHYLFRNNKDLSYDTMYIISPTTLLLAESDELSKVLGIDSVKKYSNITFYNMIIQNSSNEIGAVLPKKKHIYVSNEKISSGHLSQFYSFDELKSLYDSVFLVLYYDDIKADFIENELEEILKAKSTLLNKDYLINSKQCAFLEKAYAMYIDACNEIKGTSILNLKAVLEILYEAGTSPKNKKKKAALTLLQEHKELLGNITRYYQKHDKKGKKIDTDLVYNNPDAYSKTYKFFDLIGFPDGDGSFCSKDPFEFFEEKYRPIHEQAKALKRFIDGDNFAYLYYIICKFINETKVACNLKMNETYEWELFQIAYMMIQYSMFKIEDAKLCFVDEFQDYSRAELQLIKAVFPSAKINLWGDFNQQIIEKGIIATEFEDFIENNGVSCFEINENYRNAKEITEYINEKFGMNMVPVGLNGLVEKCNITDLNAIEMEYNDRVAVIYSDAEDMLEIVKFMNEKGISFRIVSDSEKTGRGIYNLITVQQSKGLEFEKVIAFTSKMSPKEKYVAMTRALNELYIVD